jgi:preprotein translocase subunit SecY
MMFKVLWASVVVLIAMFVLFFASLGFRIPVAYYEKSDTVMVESRQVSP